MLKIFKKKQIEKQKPHTVNVITKQEFDKMKKEERWFTGSKDEPLKK